MAQATYRIYPIYLGEIPVHDKSSFTYMVDMGKAVCETAFFFRKNDKIKKI